MDADAIRLLEFPLLKAILAGFTATGPGRELALGLEPLEDLEEIGLALTVAAEMTEASEREFRVPLGGIEDVREAVRRADAGGAPLEGIVLWQVGSFCEAAIAVGSALERLRDSYPTLGELGNDIPRCPELERRIKAAIEASGQIKDGATPRLARLRSRARSLLRQIEDTLMALTKSRSVAPHLQYPNPTICRERYVLPVNARHRSHVKGVVHGTSDSGATLYVEPFQTLELGNELSEAQGAEQEEVNAILSDLTRCVAREKHNLLAAQRVLAQVDFALAKARMAKRYRMCRPVVSRGRVLELQDARHPLLLHLTESDGEEELTRREPDFDGVVPISIHLGDDFAVLVVTGPNTGGKTVALKTVGLLCLMARAGIFLPAERAIVPLYDSVYADIGDEQSIAQSLSTFSSHMSHITRVLRSATAESLVLLDELGAGTDPIEGGALAQAILTELVRRRCSAVVTTHLGQLKTFAASCPEVENACVEFDTATLRPTYRLTIGSAGSSNALEIAERLGMPSALLSDARRQLDSVSEGRYSGMLDQVRQASKDAEGRRERARWIEAEAARLKEQYEQALHRLKDEEERTGAGIGLRMKDDLERLAKVADAIHEEVRFTHKSLAHRLREVRDGLRAALDRTADLLAGHAPERPLAPGDPVYVVKMHKWGEVVRVHKARRRATVRIGELEIEMGMDELLPWGSDFNGTVSSQ